MKKIAILLLALCTYVISAQSYPTQHIALLSLIAPNTDTVKSPGGNKYSGCWGWYQQSKNKEYAISGTSGGTYFIDITNPTTPTVSAFVNGRKGCTWREMKTYQNYCYIISSDNGPNTFKIVDMQYLPDSVHVVHDGTTYLQRGHTIWIDKDKMYIGGIAYATGTGPDSPMAIFSLATPTAPVLLKKLESDIPGSLIDYVHDMYVRNDTIYASTGWKGLQVLKYNPLTNSLTILGTYSNYNQAGYNHSSSLTKNGKYVMFADEVPASCPLHMIDVQNLENIQPLQSFYPQNLTTPHNPYIIGNEFAVVSCYQDGLYIYDISQPGDIKQVGYFDTYPQGGSNTGSYGNDTYAGNWAAYPYFPSGLIMANDMQNGVFILNPAAAYTTTTKTNLNLVGIGSYETEQAGLFVYPNPASSKAVINFNSLGPAQLEVKNMFGQVIYKKQVFGAINESLNVDLFENGIYFVAVKNSKQSLVKKLEINH